MRRLKYTITLLAICCGVLYGLVKINIICSNSSYALNNNFSESTRAVAEENPNYAKLLYSIKDEAPVKIFLKDDPKRVNLYLNNYEINFNGKTFNNIKSAIKNYYDRISIEIEKRFKKN